jgi:hypothetical protein
MNKKELKFEQKITELKDKNVSGFLSVTAKTLTGVADTRLGLWIILNFLIEKMDFLCI